MPNWIDILTENPASSWLTAGIIFLSVTTIAIVARYIAVRYLSAFAAKTRTHVDDIILLLVRKLSIAIIAVVTLYLALKGLTFPEKFSQLMRFTAISAVFLQVALWGNAVINFFLSETTRRAEQPDSNISARRAIAFLGRLVLWLLVLTLLLENLGIRLTPLLAGIGIGGVAVALALQNILGDLFCFMAIIIDKPFIVGDFLIIDNLKGTVEHIGMKTTRVRSLSGELMVFANHDMVNSRVRNYKTLNERRVVFQFGVTYDTSVEKLKKLPNLVSSIFSSLKNVRLDRVHFAQLGDFGLNFEVVYYVLSGDYNLYMDTQEAVNLSLMQELGKEKIDFAYPTQTLYVQPIQSKNS